MDRKVLFCKTQKDAEIKLSFVLNNFDVPILNRNVYTIETQSNVILYV